RIGKNPPRGVGEEFTGGISPQANMQGITTAPDGALAFTEYGYNLMGGGTTGNRVGEIATDGTVTESEIRLALHSNPIGIVTGPDGNMYMAMYQGVVELTDAGGNRIVLR